MYSEAFCKVYNEFGWNYFPEAFAEELLAWLKKHEIAVKTSMDLGCGTGVLCEALSAAGIEASGMDFSQGMIDIARERNGSIHYDVADMITYRPEKAFDLVTCTGDALNHIGALADVEKIFENVYAYLAEAGYFIFDILSGKEVPDAEPFDLDFSDRVKAQFMVTQEGGQVYLKTTVYEDGARAFEEVITETLHDVEEVCALLRKIGFTVVKCSDHLLEDENRHGASWFIVARKDTEEAAQLAAAHAFAAEKHAMQFRKGGKPYITHPEAVAAMLKEQGYGLSYQIAGLFHDLLEDTDASEEEICALGGSEVLRAVKLLTKKEGYVMAEYIADILADPMAKAVKAADRLHNLRCAVEADEAFRRRYIFESKTWYLDFSPEIAPAVEALETTLKEEQEKSGKEKPL